MISGDPDAPPRGVIPSTARAELLSSLVPDQRPDVVGEQFRKWAEATVPDHVEHAVTLNAKLDQPPYATPRDHPAVAVLADAMSDAWGRPAARMRNAGAAPVVLLTERIGAATMALFWPRLAQRLTPGR